MFKKNFLIIIVCLFLPNVLWAGDKIIFSRFTNGFWQIWFVSPDGKNEQQITNSLQDKRDPVQVKDGSRIAFRTSNSELFVVDADGKNETQYLKEYGIVTNPDFSPTSNEIAFVRFEAAVGDISDIWTLNEDTNKSMILTRDHKSKYQPRFSPDGKKIVFVKADSKKENYHIWIMDSDGNNPIQLTQGAGFDTHPGFSPDGKWITFSSNRDRGAFDIYSLNIETGEQKRLTKYDGLDTHPSFSPDGKQIAFVSDKSGNQQLWLMNADGTNRLQLTFDENESIDPKWVN